MNDFVLAFYLRLSMSDGDLGTDNKDESNSIENQRLLLSFGFGLEDGETVIRMLGGGFVLFLIPHIAAYIVAAVTVLHSALHRFIWS